MIAIVDYGLSNLLSIKRAVDLIDHDFIVTSDANVIATAAAVILPGVGSFEYGMNRIKKLQIDEAISGQVKCGTPILGICLGMQMLLTDSMESSSGSAISGLNIIPGHVVKIDGKDIQGHKQNVPHIGWEKLNLNNSSEETNGILKEYRNEEVYFVHSFEAVTDKEENQVAYCEYGGRNVSAIIRKENVVGCQFHPEKSGKVGLKMIENFLREK